MEIGSSQTEPADLTPAAVLSAYYAQCSEVTLDVTNQARALGYLSDGEWLDLVAYECSIGVAESWRLREHLEIFYQPRALTARESHIVGAVEAGDWETLEILNCLEGAHLTAAATREYLDAVFTLDPVIS